MVLIATLSGKTCIVIAGNPNFVSTSGGMNWQYVADDKAALLEEPTLEQTKEFLASDAASSLLEAGHSITKFQKMDFISSDY